ncbi:arsenate reductase/protein-tyrosine-phosphatase family protein [Rosenbergiella epipactidis]|uniref:arsenate reductase/protein-tyrosine-phosphatase family protein n=1 Tax=Rosenbergiella epipactidis TaxID=1544694 RepID=UPI000789DC68|nr:protein tyrosine phosphatase [Rosenbergiella epipactidis]KYP87564.1 protein tyrosine phosphatase [bacteria symbiont BFo2 of Frankliniella occidentalis]KYP95532.1 protein tyrosine phosphatase [bacteria symbiont BFo2 of Frankliniella occidentalis]
MFKSILVVCTGNICRSPTGERLLKKYLPDLSIDSAGTGALKNHAADDTANLVATENGLSLDGHKAKQFTSELAQRYDLILVMEKHHQEVVTRIAPEVRGKTMLFAHWMEKKQIPDPYRQSREAFEHVYRLIEQSATAWAVKLGKK